jgi:hypothetical protein
MDPEDVMAIYNEIKGNEIDDDELIVDAEEHQRKIRRTSKRTSKTYNNEKPTRGVGLAAYMKLNTYDLIVEGLKLIGVKQALSQSQKDYIANILVPRIEAAAKAGYEFVTGDNKENIRLWLSDGEGGGPINIHLLCMIWYAFNLLLKVKKKRESPGNSKYNAHVLRYGIGYGEEAIVFLLIQSFVNKFFLEKFANVKFECTILGIEFVEDCVKEGRKRVAELLASDTTILADSLIFILANAFQWDPLQAGEFQFYVRRTNMTDTTACVGDGWAGLLLIIAIILGMIIYNYHILSIHY